jgi:hypothetical protein
MSQIVRKNRGRRGEERRGTDVLESGIQRDFGLSG